MNTDEEKIVRAIRKELEWKPPTLIERMRARLYYAAQFNLNRKK
jgi:hypothetical protein